MTVEKNRLTPLEQILMGSSSGLSLEIRKTKLGAVAVIQGVLGVEELTDSSVLVLSHSGRIRFIGERLTLSVFSLRTVEIIGKITGVELSYGKG